MEERTMDWKQALVELRNLNGKSVYICIGEVGGAGEEIASFSRTLDLYEPGMDDDGRFVAQIGEAGNVRGFEDLFEGAQSFGGGLRIGQATIDLEFQDLTSTAPIVAP
jgi:hypothetical protein